MSKVKGPLFSVDAKGKLGNALVFSSNKNIKRVARHYSPKNPRTIIQQDNRSIFSYAILSWQSLSEEDKQDFNQSAKNLGLKMSGYNYYLQTYLAAYGAAPPPPTDYILDGLVSWWRMDENGGDDVNDSIGTNHGIRTGASWVPGKHNSCLEFNQGGEHVEVASPSGGDLNPDYITVLCWVKLNSLTGNSGLVSKYGAAGGTKTFNLGEISDIRGTCTRNGITAGNAIIHATPSIDTWYFAAFTYDGRYIRPYLNGVLNAGGIFDFGSSLPLHKNSAPLWIGMYYSTSYSCDALIDEVAIYNRVLSDAEILQNYQVFL